MFVLAAPPPSQTPSDPSSRAPSGCPAPPRRPPSKPRSPASKGGCPGAGVGRPLRGRTPVTSEVQVGKEYPAGGVRSQGCVGQTYARKEVLQLCGSFWPQQGPHPWWWQLPSPGPTEQRSQGRPPPTPPQGTAGLRFSSFSKSRTLLGAHRPRPRSHLQSLHLQVRPRARLCIVFPGNEVPPRPTPQGWP